MPFTIELSFRPTQVCICENYVACVNRDTMHMFEVVAASNKDANEGMVDNSVVNGDFSFKCT